MRYGWSALLLLIVSAAAASAQEQVLVSARAPVVDPSARRDLHIPATPFGRTEVNVSPDQVVARLMTFDRNGDGKVATAELSERMHVIVGRGDTSGDGALDDSELRALTARRLEFVSLALQQLRSGGYGFGDSVGLLSTRSHIHNTIEDLRLTPEANGEAKRLATTFVDQRENAARAKLRSALVPMLAPEQAAEFERNVTSQVAKGRTIRMTSPDGTSTQTFTSAVFTSGADPLSMLDRYLLTPDERKTAAAAIESFKTDQQLDEAGRSALVAQLAYVLTGEESDNFRAALARRPVVKTSGVIGGVVGSVTSATASTPR